jgi:hypothetical protein
MVGLTKRAIDTLALLTSLTKLVRYDLSKKSPVTLTILLCVF